MILTTRMHLTAEVMIITVARDISFIYSFTRSSTHSLTRSLAHSYSVLGGVPEQPEDDDGELDLRAMIDRILVNLDQWSMRVSLVEIQLLIKQATNTDGRPVARLSV